MNAYEVLFRVDTTWYQAITISPSRWAARAHATMGIRGARIESVREHIPNVNPRVFLQQTSPS